ncbi:MAG: transcription-repair coupling factor [Eubacteriaceae bacterium]|nr:transcription-repair coupling factor [Eubacteriaceae bacterium]
MPSSLKKFLDTTGLINNAKTSNSLLITGAGSEYRLLYALNAYLNGKNVIYVASGDYEAKRIFTKLEKYNAGRGLLFYPRQQLYFMFSDSHSREIDNMRQKAVHSIQRSTGNVLIITSVWALAEKRLFDSGRKLDLKVGGQIDLPELASQLVSMGFERAHKTEAPGQFSIRGGILDVFNAVDQKPYRVELYGDEIDSIRVFDETTQRSLSEKERFSVYPFSEGTMSSYERGNALQLAAKEAQASKNPGAIEHLDRIRQDPGALDKLLYMYTDRQLMSIAQMVPNPLFVVDNAPSFASSYKEAEQFAARDFLGLLEEGRAFPGQFKIFYPLEEISAIIQDSPHVGFSPLGENCPGLHFKDNFNAGCADTIDYKQSPSAFMAIFPKYIAEGYKVYFAYNGVAEKKILQSLLEGFNIHASNQVALVDTCLLSGFDCISQRILAIPASALSAQKTKAARQQPKAKPQSKEDFFTDISVGDFVVHDVHGIGIYKGIERISLQGASRDYIKIGYAKEDSLYVPTEQMGLVQKYVGSGEIPPKISRLGSGDWAATKEKARGAVKELAQEYLDMYAQRSIARGYEFAPDTEWQKDFEDQFDYEPTTDQLKSTEQIKADMCSTQPMDRLLLGDVGYGKTEVAMRAAFKAAMEGKQVAVLVPTTILALQHYSSFVNRFSQFELVKIEMLSRLKTGAESRKIANAVSKGNVDILIGTHRILSSDVAFKDLGLLIIDEEHRFGVAHKDKLKLLKQNVDTLTLSATPIPRTLHMSLIGVKDLSVIDTPPANRLPVQTHVLEYDESIVKEAILNELARDGQVFYLHNRVATIAEKADRLAKLVPGARVVFAHGQMPHALLEKTVMSFLEGAYDVLVCTSIIENGIDFVNANTIIIENANHLGLAQLYQLRGRVGRASNQAYAYMTYEKEKNISEDAYKRLASIKEFTKFGSGFKIAMRDLQIRGAGNLLGARQHGHMFNVGYEMYCRMLKDAIDEGLGVAPSPALPSQTEIALGIDAYLPTFYISHEAERIEVYKKMASIETEKDKADMLAELKDRYGPVPLPVVDLADVAYAKALAQKGEATSIKQFGDTIVVEFENLDGEGISRVMAALDGMRYKAKKNSQVPAFDFEMPRPKEALSFVMDIAKRLAGSLQNNKPDKSARQKKGVS